MFKYRTEWSHFTMTIREEYRKLKKEIEEAKLTIVYNENKLASLKKRCPHEGRLVLRSVGLSNVYSCSDCGKLFNEYIKKKVL